MTLEQFRAKWGAVLGSLLISEVLNRLDPDINTPLHHACRELSDDLGRLMAAEKATVAAAERPVISRLNTRMITPDGERS